MFLDDHVLEKYLKSIKLKKTLILNASQVHHILNEPNSIDTALAGINIHAFEFIAGVYSINQMHKNAFIVDMVKNDFYLIDPKEEHTATSAYQAWIVYYNNRQDKCIPKWYKPKIGHQKQFDDFHCGDLVVHYIEEFIKTRHLRKTIINFSEFRLKIRKILSENL